MRSRRSVLVGSLLALAACAPRSVAPLRGDGELVLELGGQARSLAQSLESLGVELLPPLQAPSGPVEAGLVGDGGAAAHPVAAAESPAVDRGRDATPTPADPAPAWIEVELGERETLMDLASRHLGTARRFREIMELNGWTDRDARRLRVGTRVKIPRPATAGASGN